MKNYLSVFAADGTWMFGYKVFIANTPGECQSQIDAFIAMHPEYVAIHGPTRVFYLMNKFTLAQILTSIPESLDPFGGFNWTFDPEEARNFGTESDKWPGIDQNDPAQVKAASIAKEVLKSNAQKKGAFGGAASLLLFVDYLRQVCNTDVEGLQNQRRQAEACELLQLVELQKISVTDAILMWSAFVSTL
jgi:hypothetical protein